MKKVCSWCGCPMGGGAAFAAEGDITHGICTPCALKVTAGPPRTASEILDFVQEPVFILDGEGVVRGANSGGRRMLDKEAEQLEDHLGGDAFECSYASLPGGCGNTEHCLTCGIRNVVMDTLATGRNYRMVPAFQSIVRGGEARVLRFLISTEKVASRILLRIDEVEQAGGAP